MVQSAVPLPIHLDLFENGIAKKLDFAFGGPQAARVAKFIKEGKLELGAIHTYLELFARYFIDPDAEGLADLRLQGRPAGQPVHRLQHRGHADHRRGDQVPPGIVIAQVNEIVDTLPRVDIPAD